MFLPSFCHLRACEMSPGGGGGYLITRVDPSVGQLNGILEFEQQFYLKKSNAGGGGGGGGGC